MIRPAGSDFTSRWFYHDLLRVGGEFRCFDSCGRRLYMHIGALGCMAGVGTILGATLRVAYGFLFVAPRAAGDLTSLLVAECGTHVARDFTPVV